MFSENYYAAIGTVDYAVMRPKIRAAEWRVIPVPMATAEQLVERYHYSHSGSSAVVFAHGLIRNGHSRCWGVAWWIPAPKLSVDKFNPGKYRTTLILHRLVCDPFAPSNAASFLLGRSIRLIEQRGKHDMLLTYADTAQGHDGTIYQATNWDYYGLSEPTAVWVDQDGAQVSAYQQGHILSHTEMRALGYSLIGYYPKHVYTMALKTRAQVVQMPMFAEGAA